MCVSSSLISLVSGFPEILLMRLENSKVVICVFSIHFIFLVCSLF